MKYEVILSPLKLNAYNNSSQWLLYIMSFLFGFHNLNMITHCKEWKCLQSYTKISVNFYLQLKI